jgi:uncharacterized protein
MKLCFEEDSLWKNGFARVPGLLTGGDCRELRELYDDSSRFRSRIDMKRYRFGQGEYQYFAHPLPDRVAQLREAWYARLSPIATAWTAALGSEQSFQQSHNEFVAQCHAAGQLRPTPLLLRYREGDYNCLHQDLYGAIYFPFQIVVCLSEPGVEFTGGELLLTEQHPRAQSSGRVVPMHAQGDAAIITTRYRPVRGSRGYYRANVRHGVSTVTSGERFTMGIVFHDAE